MSNERKVGVKAYLPLQLDLKMIAIDFIEASAILVKDKPFLGNLEWCSAYNNGTEKYWLKGCRNVEILWNESTCTLILRGSIMYYMQGHNFTFDKPTFVQGINLIGNLLHLDLWNIGMIVNIFESGAIVEADKPPKDIIGHTREGKECGLMKIRKTSKGELVGVTTIQTYIGNSTMLEGIFSTNKALR